MLATDLKNLIELIRTDSFHTGFISLVQELDQYLAKMDGKEHGYYDQFNQIDDIKHVVLAYEDDNPVGCGAIKEFDTNVMEIKRMYVRPQHRNKGIAKSILTELESWTTELGNIKCVLETGQKQVEALGLYAQRGYRQTPNYGQYMGMKNSLCFEKVLNH